MLRFNKLESHISLTMRRPVYTEEVERYKIYRTLLLFFITSDYRLPHGPLTVRNGEAVSCPTLNLDQQENGRDWRGRKALILL